MPKILRRSFVKLYLKINVFCRSFALQSLPYFASLVNVLAKVRNGLYGYIVNWLICIISLL